MTVKSGQVCADTFSTKDATGALVAPSVGPVGELQVNGVANAAVVTITGAAGKYKWGVTLPALSSGDLVSMYITATISLISTAGVVWQETADTSRVSDLAATIGAAGAGLTALGDTRLANLDATVSSRATPADVSVSLAVSATTAAAVASGSMALTLWGSFDQTVTSTSTAALGTADEILWAIKEHKATDTDAEALILVREGVGLERLAGAALVLPVIAADGSLTLGGVAGAWTLRCQLDSNIPGELEDWANRNLDAEIKAIFGDTTINLWEGVARVSYQTVREV